MDYSRKDGKPGFTRRNKDGSTTFISLEDLEREGKKEQFLKDLEKNTGKTFQQWEDSWLKRRGEAQLKLDAEKLKSQSQQPQNPTPPVVSIPVEPYKEPQTTPPAPAPKPNPNVVVSPTGEKTKFERRLPTTAELKAAQNARAAVLKKDPTKKAEAEYQAVKAGVAASKNPTTAVTGGVNPRQPIMNAYDLVLDYLLSEGHADTVEEAHYVMLQMTSEHVQEVVEERTNEDV